MLKKYAEENNYLGICLFSIYENVENWMIESNYPRTWHDSHWNDWSWSCDDILIPGLWRGRLGSQMAAIEVIHDVLLQAKEP